MNAPQPIRVTLTGKVIKDPKLAKPGSIVLKLASGILLEVEPQDAELVGLHTLPNVAPLTPLPAE